jgi:FdhE protein
MPYVALAPSGRAARRAAAEARWTAVIAARPDLEPAVVLQRRLITLIIDLDEVVCRGRLPRLSLPPKYLVAKLGRGVPAFAGEPIPVPVAVLKPTLLALCAELGKGGAGEAAAHIRGEIEQGHVDAGSLLAASVARDQSSIRTAAAHRGLAADLLWLVAELAASPFVHALEQATFDRARDDEPLAAALAAWDRGYCPACGSWPALAERMGERRVLRCSFCAAAWEPSTAACIYCGETGPRFITQATGLETCGGCSGYLKSVPVADLSPFPLLAIADLETMELDLAAMQQGFGRPSLRTFPRR